jgi:hypothetical protein
VILTPDPREHPVTGRLQIGSVDGFASERRPASNRNPRPASSEYAEKHAPDGTIALYNARFGRGSVVPARAGLVAKRTWSTKFEMRTPRYTTRLAEVPSVSATLPM